MSHATPSLQPQAAPETHGGGGTAGASAGTSVRGMLKGMSYARGSEALAPVQRKGGRVQRQAAAAGVESEEAKQSLPADAVPNQSHPDDAQADGAKQAEPGGGKGGVDQGRLAVISRELADVESMDAAFATIGDLMETLAPLPGQGFSGKIGVKVAPPLGGGFYLNLEVEGSAKRNIKNKLEVEGKMTTVIGAIGSMGIFKAHVGARGVVALKSVATSGAQAMRQVGLLMYAQIARLTKRGADWLFGKGFEGDVVKGMQSKQEGGEDADKVEGGGEVGVEGGLKAKAPVGDNEVEAKHSIGARERATIEKEKKDDTKASVEIDRGLAINAALKGKVGPLSGEGTIELFFIPKKREWECDLKVEITAKSHALKGAFNLAAAVGELFGLLRNGVPANRAAQSKETDPDGKAANDLRLILGAIASPPKTAIVSALTSVESHSVEAEAGVQLALKWEKSAFKTVSLEAVRKFAPGGAVGEGLKAAGVELEGKTTQVVGEHEAGPAKPGAKK